ncbi:UNVERIFIED_CONTAM: hypothetical protein HDU68_010085 [Siphonaria sp. JEL0065]|nr:hypothetical protein HDU68_010085 [Siphonaria sp. JEL0065]
MNSDPTLQQHDADEWEDCPDTEDSYIVLDINGFSSDSIKEAARVHGGVSLIGLDTPEPILRIGNMHFKGTFDNSLGSDVIFAASTNQSGLPKTAKDIAPSVPRYGLANAIFNKTNTPNSSNLSFMGQTDSHIKFSRIRLEQKVLPAAAASSSSSASSASSSAPMVTE